MYTKKDLERYVQDDFISVELREHPEDDSFMSQRWLLDIPAKRMIYADVYGELLRTTGKRVLDVGGGFCAVSRRLITNHEYTLVDILSRYNESELRAVESQTKPFLCESNWIEFVPDGMYDYVIANDLFPNVDQRLEKFIQKFKPHAKQMVLVLTCYDQTSLFADVFEKVVNRLYAVFKRVDADKIIFVRSPTTKETNKMLRSVLGESALVLGTSSEHIFDNGRTVSKIIL
jgi:hypothetical protein